MRKIFAIFICAAFPIASRAAVDMPERMNQMRAELDAIKELCVKQNCQNCRFGCTTDGGWSCGDLGWKSDVTDAQKRLAAQKAGCNATETKPVATAPAAAKKFTISYDPTGGQFSPGINGERQECTEGTEFALARAPEKVNSRFGGWRYRDSVGTLVRVGAGAKETCNRDFSFEAAWNNNATPPPPPDKSEQKTFSITYDLNGGRLPSGVEWRQECTEGTEFALAPAPEKADSRFDGWKYQLRDVNGGNNGMIVRVGAGASQECDRNFLIEAVWTDMREADCIKSGGVWDTVRINECKCGETDDGKPQKWNKTAKICEVDQAAVQKQAAKDAKEAEKVKKQEEKAADKAAAAETEKNCKAQEKAAAADKTIWHGIKKECECADKTKFWDGFRCVADADLVLARDKENARREKETAELAARTEAQKSKDEQFMSDFDELTNIFNARIAELSAAEGAKK